jgi:hypothetical protein
MEQIRVSTFAGPGAQPVIHFTDAGSIMTFLAPHLREGHQRPRLVGLYRQRPAARRRHALPHARQISVA